VIPRAHITAWRSAAPWATDAQVEQDLVICRALTDLYSEELLAREVAFRGGTALHKLHFDSPARYSEDIDLVQVNAGPIGPVMQAVRARLSGLDAGKVVACFTRYMEHDGRRVTQTQVERNLAEKIQDEAFLGDVPPLLAFGVSFDPPRALDRVRRALISRLPEGAFQKRERRKP